MVSAYDVKGCLKFILSVSLKKLSLVQKHSDSCKMKYACGGFELLHLEKRKLMQ